MLLKKTSTRRRRRSRMCYAALEFFCRRRIEDDVVEKLRKMRLTKQVSFSKVLELCNDIAVHSYCRTVSCSLSTIICLNSFLFYIDYIMGL